MADFQRLRPYDLPSVYLNNILEGRIHSVGIHPENMTYLERERFGEDMKKKAPQNPVIQAGLNVAFNPLVWIALGLGARYKLPQIAKMFDLNAGLNPIIRKHFGLLGSFGKYLKTGEQTFAGTDVAPILSHVHEGRRNFTNKINDMVTEPTVKFLTKNKAKDLLEVKDAQKLLYAKLAGLDGDDVQYYMDAKGNRKRRVVKAIVDPALLDQAMRKYPGLHEYADDVRKTFDHVLTELYGVDPKTGKVVNPDKLTRLYRGIASGALGRGENPGAALIGRLFGDQNLQKLARAKTMGNLQKMLEDMFQVRKNYMPRMAKTFMDTQLKNLGPDELERYMQKGSVPDTLRVGGTSVARYASPVWHIDDLIDFERLGIVGSGQRKAITREYKRTQKRLDQLKTGKYRIASFNRANFKEAFQNYVSDTSRQYALYVQDVPQDIAKLQEVWDPALAILAKEAPQNHAILSGKRMYKGKGAPTVLEKFTTQNAPIAGWTPWDAIKRSYNILDHGIGQPTVFARDMMTDVYMPLASGRVGYKSAWLAASARQMQSGLHYLMNETPVPEFMKKAGLGSLEKSMRLAADTEWNGLTSSYLDSSISNAFYSSMLGLNLGSVVINMLQPIMTTARYTGPQALAEGYVNAFRDMARYAADRSKVPGLLLGDRGRAARTALVNKSIPHAKAFGISENFLDSVDHLNRPATALPRDTKFSKFQQFLLGPFEHAEMFNKLVTGHATLAKARADGLNTALGAAGNLQDLRLQRVLTRTIEEAQFSPALMNRPNLFANPKSALSSQTLHQFLTFPVRNLTSLVEGGRLGGRSSTGLQFMGGPDFWRTLAYGAITYDVGRAFGLDLAPATVFGSAAETFERTDQPFWPLPVSPALSTGAKLLKAGFEGDSELTAQSLMNVIPGGLALTKAMGMLPDLSDYSSLNPQKTYADYSAVTPDGRVPIYDPNGRLITYASRVELALRATGFDRLGQFSDEREVVQWLLKNREQMTTIKNDYINQMINGNVPKAQDIGREFRERFGFDISISKSQLQSVVDQKTRPRVERTLNMLPEELRKELAPGVAETLGARLGMDKKTFVDANNASERDLVRTYPLELSHDMKRAMQQMIKDRVLQEQAIGQRKQAFDSFGGF